jgi:hypothetical protein
MHNFTEKLDMLVWQWISERVAEGRGDVSFGLTENGTVYVRWYDERYVPMMASGENAHAAVRRAVEGASYPDPAHA